MSSLDLTGNPLIVDLGGNDTLNVTNIIEKPTSWTLEENLHHPMSLQEAGYLGFVFQKLVFMLHFRNYINNNLRNHNTAFNNKAVYCICNDFDEEEFENTVILGAFRSPKELVRVIVYVMPCFNNEESFGIEAMTKIHLGNVIGDSSVGLFFFLSFFLECCFRYGIKLRKYIICLGII